METLKSIESRRSIRKYKDIEVDNNILLEAIKYGTLAPSAHNFQPWKFKILTTEEKNHIADLLEAKTSSIEGHTGPHTASIIRETPAMIMIFIDSNHNRDMDVISIGACIENMILYLTDKDIGTLWIGNTNLVNDEIKEYLNVPYDTISCLGVGYKDQDPHARPRKDINDIIIK